MTEINSIPAATLVLMRERIGRAPELLMIERAAAMVFAPGALVFPGGRVDPGDHAIAADPDRLLSPLALEPDDAAARVAAIRETIEEVGIAVGIEPAPGRAELAQLRAALAETGDFAALLSRGNLRLDLGRLIPFARWCPNMSLTRNFDTRFYLAAAPEQADAIADGGESVHFIWADAAAVLADADAGHHRIVFPTRRNLERLASLDSFAAATEHASHHPVIRITPWIEEREGARWLCIPEDCGYPTTAELTATAMRG